MQSLNIHRVKSVKTKLLSFDGFVVRKITIEAGNGEKIEINLYSEKDSDAVEIKDIGWRKSTQATEAEHVG